MSAVCCDLSNMSVVIMNVYLYTHKHTCSWRTSLAMSAKKEDGGVILPPTSNKAHPSTGTGTNSSSKATSSHSSKRKSKSKSKRRKAPMHTNSSSRRFLSTSGDNSNDFSKSMREFGAPTMDVADMQGKKGKKSNYCGSGKKC